MRLVLAGTRSFGAAALDAILADGHDVALVVAPEDDRLHDRAWTHRLPLSTGMHADAIRKLDTDVIIGAHSHAFVGRQSRAATRLGAFGYHPSLLPLHRGKDAVRWTIRDRDRIAGGTCYWFNDTVDGGPVAAQDWCHVRPGWNAIDLWSNELFPMGLRLIREVLDQLKNGLVVAVPQDESLATVEPSFAAPRLHRPELPAIGPGPEGFDFVASREDPRLAGRHAPTVIAE